MNKYVASLGLLALGTTALHAVEATAVNSMQRDKPWSVAASLRGFYDDNINATEIKEESFGFEITPSVDFGLAGDQTSFNLGYQLSAKWYEQQLAGQTDHWDYTHIFEGVLSHTFSPRVKMALSDSFVIGQEPDLLRAGNNPVSTAQQIPGNNIINYGRINFDIEATEMLGLQVGYDNAYYNYAQDGQPFPSSSGLLDRIENRFTLDTRWKLRPQTFGLLGYTYGLNLYTGDEPLSTLPPPFINATSENKNSRSHTFSGGVQHSFTPTLSGMIRVGAQYFDYYNDPITGDSEWSPYVQGNLNYQYQSTTKMGAGFSYSRSAADQGGFGSVNVFVKDVEVAMGYVNFSHEIIPHLVGSANATVQHATYNGGGPAIDGESYLFLSLGFDLAYQLTQHLSLHAGYNYDDNDSDLAGQSYNRNRVYVGLTAGY